MLAGRNRFASGAVALLLCLTLILMSSLTLVTWQHQQNLACAGVGGDSSVPQPVGNRGAALNVRIGTWNTLASNNIARVLSGIRAVGAQADVIGLQELDPGSRRAVKKGLSDTFAVSKGNNAVQIVWKKARFDVLAQGSQEVFGLRRIEPGVSGTAIGPKSVQWVQLRDRTTGAVFFVANHHIVPSVDRRGHPDIRHPKRLSLYELQLAAMLALVDRLKGTGPVMVTGDFNVAAAADAKVRDPSFPYVQGAAHGLYSNWRVLGHPDGGTQGARLIDYVWSTTASAAPVAQWVLPKHGSDHSPVVVAVSNRSAVAKIRPQQSANAALPTRAIASDTPVDETRRQQIANIRLIEKAVLDVARPPRLPAGVPAGRVAYIAAVAATGESDLINVSYGDRVGPDSRGLFQQRTNWGTLAQRMDPVYATKSFLLGPGQHGSGGLLDLKDWAKLPVTIAIHRVQINADPQHYRRFEARAQEIGAQAGVDFHATGASGPAVIELQAQAGCLSEVDLNGGMTVPATAKNGACPLDTMYAKGHQNTHDCNQAIAFMEREMNSGSRAWRRRCLALVAQAYGWRASGTPTAFQGAQIVTAAGRVSTDRTGIPRGAVMWWDGRPAGNSAGHVAIYDGAGYILSNDVPVTDGRVGRVPWTYPEQRWGHKWLGWSPPYFPNAV